MRGVFWQCHWGAPSSRTHRGGGARVGAVWGRGATLLNRCHDADRFVPTLQGEDFRHDALPLVGLRMHDDGLPRVACKLAVRAPHSGGVRGHIQGILVIQDRLGRRVFPWDGDDPRPGGRLDRPGDRHDRPRRRGLQYQVTYSSSAENSRFLKIDVTLAARAPIDDIRSFCPKGRLGRVYTFPAQLSCPTTIR